jgi:nucleotide-binding universal stress UspA family protein
MKTSRPGNKARQHVLVPVDFSGSSVIALRYAIDLTAASGGALTIVHVVDADYGWSQIGRDESAELDKSLQKQAVDQLGRLADSHLPQDMPADLEVRIGRPAEEIVAAASEAKSDLIVISSHGRTGLDRYLIGSVAERVARIAPCPVCLIPPPKRKPSATQSRSPVLRLKHQTKLKRLAQ